MGLVKMAVQHIDTQEYVDELIDEMQGIAYSMEIEGPAKTIRNMIVDTLDILRNPGATYLSLHITRPTFRAPANSMYFREKTWYYTFHPRGTESSIENMLHYFGCQEVENRKKADILVLETLLAETRAATLVNRGNSIKFITKEYFDSQCSYLTGLPKTSDMLRGTRGYKFFKKQNVVIDAKYIKMLLQELPEDLYTTLTQESE